MPVDHNLAVPCHPDETVPTQYPIDLHYLETYEQKGLLSYIQDVRSRAIMVRRTAGVREAADVAFEHERAYWRRLGESCGRLVEQVKSSGIEFDLIADPPSNTGFHRPYLAELHDAYRSAAYCYFVKDRHLEAGAGNIRFADLEGGTRLRSRDDTTLAKCRFVLIVDDIFSNGLTASVVVHKLRPLVHADARFAVACPLRLPAKNDGDELQQMIAAMSR